MVRSIPSITFAVGDKVTFELTPLGSGNSPRWNERNADTGTSGNWCCGNVIKITGTFITVCFEIENFIGEGLCDFPNIMHNNFDKTQWCWPGYLKKFRAGRIDACECGGTVTGLTHSHWCPVRK